MIKLIAAIDLMRGIADDKGIPWDLPSDKNYYREKIQNGIVIMGYGTYKSHPKPLNESTNYVYLSPRVGGSRPTEPLREGFKPVYDLDTFLRQRSLIWVLGGSQLFELAIPYADELYITQVEGDFSCTKFFPVFENFTEVDKSKIKKENGTRFQYQVWKANRLITSFDYDEEDD